MVCREEISRNISYSRALGRPSATRLIEERIVTRRHPESGTSFPACPLVDGPRSYAQRPSLPSPLTTTDRLFECPASRSRDPRGSGWEFHQTSWWQERETGSQENSIFRVPSRIPLKLPAPVSGLPISTVSSPLSSAQI